MNHFKYYTEIIINR